MVMIEEFMMDPCPKGVCERLAGTKTANRLRNENAELIKTLSTIKQFVASDKNTVTYQSIGQYRNAILKIFNDMSN